MRAFYEAFYRALPISQSYGRFCAAAFGCNLAQHGFADLHQLQALLETLQLAHTAHLLDLGCGNGLIAEYLAAATGAEVTGLDYIPQAIAQAQARVGANVPRRHFVVGDINALELPSATFDAIVAIDTIYFSNDYAATVCQLKAALRPRGQLAFFYSYGWGPWLDRADFAVASLAPDQTPLAYALQSNGLTFTAQDFTGQDYQLALQRKALLVAQASDFAAEALLFLYNNRLAECNGIIQAYELGLHRRYLYHATTGARR